MSTSVNTPATGQPARGLNPFLGWAVAGLAAVIAIGVGFAVNQGTEASVSNVDVGLSERATQAWSDRLTGHAEWLAERQATSPAANIEQYKLENGIIPVNEPAALAYIPDLVSGTEASRATSPAANIEQYKPKPELDTMSPALNQRLAHEVDVEQRVAPGSVESNPMEGIAE